MFWLHFDSSSPQSMHKLSNHDTHASSLPPSLPPTHRDIAALNLTMFVSELVQGVIEAKLKPADVPAAVQVRRERGKEGLKEGGYEKPTFPCTTPPLPFLFSNPIILPFTCPIPPFLPPSLSPSLPPSLPP